MSTDHSLRKPNRLIHESSPYLRQHAHNPVDWYPWGPEAHARSREENRPILLSIGYAACHWCHVMERESFEDEPTAALMNQHFVCIKVDREERPDLDAIYMQATQTLTGRGGWPMTVFLTPEAVPYYAGTYFPPEGRYGIPSFRQVLVAMAEAFRRRPDDVARVAAQMRADLLTLGVLEGTPRALDFGVFELAVKRLRQRFDERFGGFGGAPRFPQTMSLRVLLRHFHRTRDSESLHQVVYTLRKMAHGGIHDQIGGGFHRYSVDEAWLVPHFEKMLYDNALLAGVYLEAWQITKEPLFKSVCTDTIEYVLRDMVDAEGGFYATEDADSEGEEGRFYVWNPDQVQEALGDERLSDAVCAYYDVLPGGNFEHRTSILNVPRDADVVAATLGVRLPELHEAVATARARLLEARGRRVRPARDEKILAAWNGLMLDVLSRAAGAFERSDWMEAAKKNGAFLMRHLWQAEGRMFRAYKDGHARLNGYLEDYAAVAHGLSSLYELTGDVTWFEQCRVLVDRMVLAFEDPQEGGFYFTSHDHEVLLARVRDPYDDATPSGASLAVGILQRLAAWTGERSYAEKAERVLRQACQSMGAMPGAFGELLCDLYFHLETPCEVALVAHSRGDAVPFERVLFEEFVPTRVLAACIDGDERAPQVVPLLAGKRAPGCAATAFVCHNFQCDAPVSTPEALRTALGARPALSKEHDPGA